MELLNAGKHLACFNYDRSGRPQVEIARYAKGEVISTGKPFRQVAIGNGFNSLEEFTRFCSNGQEKCHRRGCRKKKTQKGKNYQAKLHSQLSYVYFNTISLPHIFIICTGTYEVSIHI